MMVKEREQNTDLPVVNEAINEYVRKIDENFRKKMETRNIHYFKIFENKMLLIKVIRKGIPFNLFSKIAETTPFSELEWAEYLNLSKKTLQRYRNEVDYLFKPIHTEKILELAEVTIFGLEVFDSKEQFYLWLKTPSLALGNLKPAELLKDSYGKELVIAELNRIDQGIFV